MCHHVPPQVLLVLGGEAAAGALVRPQVGMQPHVSLIIIIITIIIIIIIVIIINCYLSCAFLALKVLEYNILSLITYNNSKNNHNQINYKKVGFKQFFKAVQERGIPIAKRLSSQGYR